MRSLALWPITPLSQVMSPTSSTITTTQRPLKFSSRSHPATQGPRTCMTRRSVTTKTLSSPLFTQEREEPAGRRQAYHSLDESLLPSQSLSVCHVRTGRPVHELSSLSSSVREKQVATQKMSKSGFFWNDKKSRFSLIIEQRFRNMSSRQICDRRNIQKLNGTTESQRGEINRALAGDEQLRRDQQLLHEQLLEQNRELREGLMKSLNEMEELGRFQGSTFDTFSRRKFIEDRDTILNSQPRFRNYRMKLIA